ncbi:hydrophobe/amphiphile efflux-3 (HAE3) family transporter [Thermococcus argininiproducens]|uniref:Hydrophobe/amphiphile efflux-3 (HAE3) family transporter n=1 Tax=Thermococcus argininiproducens TaxID=2866384 RepID=A0A9E7SCY6_9EURY|nr:hydrophobe/amphiphile efflux-3 (HAE3) family transporter [Thermococcus argininiproducens]USH00266.1 hydrophobe/amphiphile efflux-3 (HAE3) family transporter [Thermococcus argininiproducens]
MLKRLARIIVEYKSAFSLIAIFLLIVSFYGIQQLRFESDITKQLPEDLPAVKDYLTLQNEFQSGDSAIIIVRVNSIQEGGVYDIRDPEVIKAIYNLEERLRQHEYVTSTMSIADICIQVLGRLPENEEEVKFVLSMLSEDMKQGLISSDYRATLVMATLTGVSGSTAIKRVHTDIQVDIEEAGFPKNVEAIQTGILGITYRILVMLQSDLTRTMAIAFLFVVLLLIYFYRSPIKALIPLIPLTFGVTMTLGFMGLLNIPIDMVTTVIGAMIIGTGIDYGVHVTNRYYEERKKGRSIEESAEEAIAETGKALLGAALTTMAGFAALSFSVLPSLQRLSFVLIMGLSLAAINAVVITPAVIMVEEELMKKFKGHYETPEIRAHSGFIARIFHCIGGRVKTHPKTVLWVVFLITIVFGYGLTKVTTEVRLEKMIPEGIPEIEVMKDVRYEFGGQDEVYMLIKAEDVRDPTIVRAMYRFEKSIMADSHYNNVFEANSIADLILQEYGYIPEDKEKIKNVLANAQGQNLVNDDYSLAIIQFRGNFGGVRPDDFREIMRYFENQAKSADFPPTVEIRPAGDNYLNYVLDSLTNQELGKISTYGTFLVIFIVVLLFRNFKISLAMILPMFLGALWTVGYMGLAGIPFTQTLAGVISMIVGLGVDYGMHLTHRFLEEFKENNPHPIITALEGVGPGILVGALTTAGGFLALLAGELTAIHDFGKTLAVGIFASMFAAFTVTPALLQIFYGREIERGDNK